MKSRFIRCGRQIVLLMALAGVLAAWACGRGLFSSESTTPSGETIVTATPTGSAAPTPTATPTAAAQAFAFVANHNDAKVTVFARDPNTGELSPKSNVDAGEADGPAGVAVAPDNRAVYVANSADGNVYQYSFAPAASTLSPMNPGAIGNAPDGGTEMLASDPANNLLFATNSRTGTIASYRIDGRTDALSPAASLALPGDSEPFGVAVDSAHSRVYVSDRAAGLVYGFSYDRSGRMKLAGEPAASAGASGGHPGTLILDRTNKSLYAIDTSSGAVSRFSIERGRPVLGGVISPSSEPGSNNLTARQASGDNLGAPILMASGLVSSSSRSPQAAQSEAGGYVLGAAAADPPQHFVYATNQIDGTVRVFAVGGRCPPPRGTCVKMTIPAEDPASPGSRPLGIALTH